MIEQKPAISGSGSPFPALFQLTSKNSSMEQMLNFSKWCYKPNKPWLSTGKLAVFILNSQGYSKTGTGYIGENGWRTFLWDCLRVENRYTQPYKTQGSIVWAVRNGQYFADSKRYLMSTRISWRYVQSRRGERGFYTLTEIVKLWSSLPRVGPLNGLKS